MRQDTYNNIKSILSRVSKENEYKFNQYEESEFRSLFGSIAYLDWVSKIVSCFQQYNTEREQLETEISNLILRFDTLEEKLKTQAIENKKLSDENNELKKIIDTYNKNYLQRSKLKAGEKIALREDVSREEIEDLAYKGLTRNQIADKLNCSRSTIWRRMNEG